MSEVVALNVGDIIADGEYTVMKLTIKGGQAHRVPAPPEALAAVNEYLSMSGQSLENASLLEQRAVGAGACEYNDDSDV